MISTVLALGLLLQEGKVQWVRDHDEALKAAKESGKPILIYFSCC